MEKSESVPDIAHGIDEQDVVQYLKQNPYFFIRNAALAEQLKVPHAVQEAISLPELVMSTQRQKIKNLEQDIRFMVEQAHENGQLFDELLYLVIEMSSASSLREMLFSLNRWAKKLGLSGATVRLFNDCWRLSAPLDACDLMITRRVFEPVRIQRFGSNLNYLGRLNGPEIQLLLPDAHNVGSVAISLFGHHGESGMVIFTSRDRDHYQQGMGTVMLEKVAQILPRLLCQWIERL
ncbi:Uncharacterized protein conserved in bacteria [Providencia rustigianii]|uniref:DUF484 domain-containing protein n=2 Tax=Providencia rustigianii TaxID=158850 RepID=D1P2X1_9GAMM|nr:MULTISPECIES: DUF484 domain-containing protein [Providencia]EFB72476.1 hypothetical protein PROVRUST_06551 [Providencia rustigianii DSM 4541]MTC55769.1 DUF484 family protein [Providencia rustigianii]SPY79175.1 Uncharacterized protein conserved in bacteria [Providencia rustigianii]SUC28851.1 Uncharacterized protein conserved in bacteria [Providencia rustigianii]VEB76126.1 Uncharacterized protein conserved in bacteria [Providencia rustigianii]